MEVISDPMKNIWKQVNNQVRNQVWNQVSNQIENQVYNQVWNQVESQVENQVWNQVSNQVRNRAAALVRDLGWILSMKTKNARYQHKIIFAIRAEQRYSGWRSAGSTI